MLDEAAQHLEKPVERYEPGVPGFRDYARNDEVEDPTLYGEYRDVMLRVLPCKQPCHSSTIAGAATRYSTVTDLARFLGLSTSVPLCRATW